MLCAVFNTRVEFAIGIQWRAACDNCDCTILDFAAMCRNVEQLLKFLDQHHVVLQTGWWQNINTSALVSFPLLRYVTVVTSRMHFQRWMQSSGVSYGSAVIALIQFCTYLVTIIPPRGSVRVRSKG